MKTLYKLFVFILDSSKTEDCLTMLNKSFDDFFEKKSDKILATKNQIDNLESETILMLKQIIYDVSGSLVVSHVSDGDCESGFDFYKKTDSGEKNISLVETLEKDCVSLLEFVLLCGIKDGLDGLL